MRRKMLPRCSIFSCRSLLNFSTLQWFFWLQLNKFFCIFTQLHATMSKQSPMITSHNLIQLSLDLPQLWAAVSVWQVSGSYELKRLGPVQHMDQHVQHVQHMDLMNWDAAILCNIARVGFTLEMQQRVSKLEQMRSSLLILDSLHSCCCCCCFKIELFLELLNCCILVPNHSQEIVFVVVSTLIYPLHCCPIPFHTRSSLLSFQP